MICRLCRRCYHEPRCLSGCVVMAFGILLRAVFSKAKGVWR